MPELAILKAWAEKNLKVKGGAPFSLKGREWVLDHVWRPLNGFKLWPIDAEKVCDDCLRLRGRIVEWTWEPPGGATGARNALGEVVWTSAPEHLESESCAGLELHPVVLLALKLPRRSGKTVNVGAYALACCALSRGFQATYFATAGEQNERLFAENFVEPLKASGILDPTDPEAEAYEVGESIRWRHTDSEYSFAVSSAKAGAGSNAGYSRPLLVFDEARALAHQTFTIALPAVWDQRGWECPRGHLRVPWSASLRIPEKCPGCKRRLVPWYGRVVVMSSAQELQGGDADWFPELFSQLQTEEDPGAHSYEAARHVVNPAVSAASVGTFERVLGRVGALRHAVAVEVHDQSIARGDQYLDAQQVKAAELAGAQVDGSAQPAVGFLDCSLSDELTTLVLLEDVGLEQGQEPWAWLRQAHVALWAPNPTRVRDAFADRVHLQPCGAQVDEVEIWAYLAQLLPRWPGLRALGVDTRGLAWAGRLVSRAGKDASAGAWGARVQGWQRREDERATAFSELEERVHGLASNRGEWPTGKKAVALLPIVQQRAEFGAARRTTDVRGNARIEERGSRRKRHLDVVDALAMACLLAHRESLATQAVSFADLRESRSTPRRSGGGGTSARLLARVYRGRGGTLDPSRF